MAAPSLTPSAAFTARTGLTTNDRVQRDIDPRRALRRAGRHLRGAATALWVALRAARHAHRRAAADRQVLQGMSEQELRDLGLGRGEIGHLCDHLDEHLRGPSRLDHRR